MSDYSEKVEKFLDEGLDGASFSGHDIMDDKLAEAIIEILGGENAFKEQAEYIADNGVDNHVEGFTNDDSLLSFYNLHIDAIMSTLWTLDSVVTERSTPSAINTLAIHVDESEYGGDEIAQGVYGNKNDPTILIYRKVAIRASVEIVTIELCKMYQEFVEYD